MSVALFARSGVLEGCKQVLLRQESVGTRQAQGAVRAHRRRRRTIREPGA